MPLPDLSPVGATLGEAWWDGMRWDGQNWRYDPAAYPPVKAR
ncbi:hypothetical protein [Roseomonas sp. BN140053]